MIYKPFKELRLSSLGMGAMRLPKAAGQGERINGAKALELIDYAYEKGVNYFDTAYRYHGGESETFVGRALSRYQRDSFYLATKMPGHMMEYQNGAYRFTGSLAHAPSRSPREIFEEQLEKCRTDYFDWKAGVHTPPFRAVNFLRFMVCEKTNWGMAPRTRLRGGEYNKFPIQRRTPPQGAGFFIFTFCTTSARRRIISTLMRKPG